MTKISKKRTTKSEAFKILEELYLWHMKEKYPSNPYLPRKKFNDKTANNLTKCIVEFMNISGWQAERISSLGRRVDNTKTATDILGRSRRVGSVQWIKGSGQVGTADISATISGRSVKIEVKCEATGDYYQSEEQKRYQRKVEAAGGTYFIARTFQSFYDWYKDFINENSN